jgi:hypothetical protein
MVFMTTGGRDAVSELIFGDPAVPDLSKYESEVTSPGGIAGVYAGTRSIRHGFYKIMGILSMLPLSYKGDNEYDAAGVATIKQISDNMIVLNQNDHSYPGYVYKISDGTTIITLGSQSFALDKTIVPSIALLAVFLIIAVLGFFMILFKLIGILAKKNDGYQGSFFVTLSQIFRIFCVIPVLVLIEPYSDQYGITRAQGYFFFGVEAAGLAVFAVTLVSSVIGLISKNENSSPKVNYVLSIIGSCISISTLLMLEMLNIWGI